MLGQPQRGIAGNRKRKGVLLGCALLMRRARTQDGLSGRMQRMHTKACKLSLLFSEANFEEFCFVFHLYSI
jgi:hypothetical protein